MPSPVIPKAAPLQLRRKSRILLSAASVALGEPLALAAAYKTAAAFKAGLLKRLAEHPDFDRAARDLHQSHLEALRLKAGVHGNQIPVTVRPSGRVQATRYDPSQGQRDRQRGHREPGGRREGQRSYKGAKA